MKLTPVAVALVLSLTACRDEQAGPRKRPSPAPAATQRGEPPADLTFRSGATLGGGALRYHGARVQRRNADAEVTHFFEALEAPPAGYGFFAHVIDAESGQMVSNADHPFQGGAMPLERWPVGAIVSDTHVVSNLPEGRPLRLVLGFWRGEQRLPVDAGSAHDGAHRLLGPMLGGTAASEFPQYFVKRTNQPPEIDGDLGDAAWRNAVETVLVNSFNGGPTAVRTTARLVHDGANLYVAFDCEDRDIHSTFANRDDPLYTQEVVELFIDADGDGRTYDELQVSPRNVLFDAYFPARRTAMDTSWNPALVTAVRVRGTVNVEGDDDHGWSVEMKIPLDQLHSVPKLPVSSGDRWRFNLYRLEIRGVRQPEGHAFSPLFVGDFHHLPRFGVLVFE